MIVNKVYFTVLLAKFSFFMISCSTSITRMELKENLVISLTGEIQSTNEVSSPLLFSYKKQPCFGFVAARNTHFYIYSISNNMLLDSFDLKEFFNVSGLAKMKSLFFMNNELAVVNPIERTITVFNVGTKTVQQLDLRNHPEIERFNLVSLAKHPLIVTDSFVVCPIAYTDMGLQDSIGLKEYFSRPTDILINRYHNNIPEYEWIGCWPSNYTTQFFDEVYSRKFHTNGVLHYFFRNSDSVFKFNINQPTYRVVSYISGIEFKDYPISNTLDKFEMRKYQVEKEEIYQTIQDQLLPNRFLRFIKSQQTYTNNQDLVNPVFGNAITLQLVQNDQVMKINPPLRTNELFVEFPLLVGEELYFLKRVNAGSIEFIKYEFE